jgi:hypothetical protein
VVRLRLDLLEHQQLRAVEMPDDGHAGRDALGRLVERREVMEVQDVRVGGAGGRSARAQAAT